MNVYYFDNNNSEKTVWELFSAIRRALGPEYQVYRVGSYRQDDVMVVWHETLDHFLEFVDSQIPPRNVVVYGTTSKPIGKVAASFRYVPLNIKDGLLDAILSIAREQAGLIPTRTATLLMELHFLLKNAGLLPDEQINALEHRRIGTYLTPAQAEIYAVAFKQLFTQK